jgi:CheY-like chemotaxis protein
MEEVNQQQLVQNRDLLQRLAELTQKVDGASPSPAKDNGRVVSPSPSVSNLVLWVDDNPGNNAFFVEYLGKAGIQTDIAVSTAVGQRKFKPGKYRFVISDMGRRERHGYNSDAGIDLLDAVRAEDQSVPFFIYCSTQAKNRFGQIALDRGASGVTASPTELFSLLGIGQQELGL